MDAYVSNTTWSGVADRVRSASRIALVTHTKPDGDALGSVLALARALPGLGKQADAYLMGPVGPALRTLAGATPVRLVEHDPPGDDYDLVVIVDTGAWTQLEPLRSWLGRHHDRAIVLDHHPHGDDVSALRVVDVDAAATTQMVLALLDELGCPPPPETGGGPAEALFVGLATDTGWFRFPNAGAEALRVAARLLDLGVDKSRLYRLVEETYRPERLAIEARALASTEFVWDGTVALASLGRQDFEETGATSEDLTDIVNRPMIVGRVEVAILLAETAPGATKVSLRSKSRPGGRAEAIPCADVSEIARRLGGGGHVFAAGAQDAVGLDEAKQAVLDALASASAGAGR